MQFANPHFHILRPFFEFLVYCEAAFFYYSAASSSTILTRMQRKKPKNPQCRGAQWAKNGKLAHALLDKCECKTMLP